MLDLLADALAHLRSGADARTQLELALVKAARADLDPSVAALATRIERLEHGATTLDTLAAPAAPEPASAPAPPVQPPSAPTAPPVAASNGASAPAEPDAAVAPERDAAPLAKPAIDSLTFERLVAAWPDVLDTVRASNAMLGAVVDVAAPVELEGDRLVLAFGEDAVFERRKAEERAARTALSDAVRAVTGHALTFSYEVRAGHTQPPPEELSEDELVARLKDEFGAIEEEPG